MRGWARSLGVVVVMSGALVGCTVSGDVEVTDSEAIDVTDSTTPSSDETTDTTVTDTTISDTTEPTRPRPRPTFESLPPPPTPGPGGGDDTITEVDLEALAEDIAEQNGITVEQARCFIDGMLENYTIDEIIALGDTDFSTLPPEEQEALLAIYTACIGATPDSTTPGDTTPPLPPAVAGGLVGDVGLIPAGTPDQVEIVSVTTIDREPLLFIFRNNTGAAVAANTLTGTVTGPDGAALGELSVGYSVPDSIGPGGVGMFVQFTSDIGGPFPAGSTIDATLTPGPPDVSSLIVPLELSGLSVTGGTVTNTTDQTITTLFVEAACLDDAGTPLDYDIQIPNDEDVPPGASLPVSFQFFDPGCTRIVAAAEGFL